MKTDIHIHPFSHNHHIIWVFCQTLELLLKIGLSIVQSVFPRCDPSSLSKELHSIRPWFNQKQNKVKILSFWPVWIDANLKILLYLQNRDLSIGEASWVGENNPAVVGVFFTVFHWDSDIQEIVNTYFNLQGPGGSVRTTKGQANSTSKLNNLYYTQC